MVAGLIAAAVLAVVAVVAVVAGNASHDGARASGDGSPAGSAAPPSAGESQRPTADQPAAQHWMLILQRLNVTRAHAWADAKPDHLARVFAPKSDVLVADQRALRDYVLRGLHVDGVQLQIGRVVVDDRTDGRVELTVVDRLGPVEVQDSLGQTRTLPDDKATLHRVILTRTHAGWRISSVRAV
jgi:hypothetical protein